jgi:hypothetical protein
MNMTGVRGGAVDLRDSATSRKVAGSIPYGFIVIFRRLNPSGRTMALGSTQLLTEMSIGDLPWCVGLTILPPSCADWRFWEPHPPDPLWDCAGPYRDSFFT